jgi:hypothetical protein
MTEGHDPDRILYQDNFIIISMRDRDLTEHNVSVGDAYCLLQKGVLEDLSKRREIGSFARSLQTVNYDFALKLKEQRFSLENLAWAMAKARMNELERERDYFIGQAREAREGAFS